MPTITSDATMAVFLDLENIALGARDAKYPSFDINKVLERLLLKGHIVVKKAYCDFDRYKDFKRGLHEAAFELIEIPHVRQSGKNSADIRMVVDALDLCYTKGHVDTFVILSGDSDFSPLVSKLRENAKTVIGVGVKNSTSDLFLNNCDEFIYYDDLVRKERTKRRRTGGGNAGSRAAATPAVGAPAGSAPTGSAPTGNAPTGNAPTGNAPAGNAPADSAQADSTGPSDNKAPDPADALDLVLETLDAVTEERGENEQIWGSMIKQAIKRRHPGFNERFYGFRSFNDLLADAEKRGLLTLRADEKSGGYTVRKSWMWAEACARLDEAERRHRHFYELLAGPSSPVWEPPANIVAQGREIEVTLALPGARAEDVVAKITPSGLLIETNVAPPQFRSGGEVIRMEIPYGRMRRRIDLPAGSYALLELRLERGYLHLRLTGSPL